ncbi:FtsW/RodA/SpoVE family cell cycle protein [Patulibacter defluvii]|uniref:FtsW/RodA/SpoVE family cell cycle protein n=1 Tax=Patulibacter defluvii TaxID=3095358 RepID=UPI002A74DB19|nr:FtsW/RodA/SpoVE family cell cycle protein [Patulibacter sp. DM4]
MAATRDATPIGMRLPRRRRRDELTGAVDLRLPFDPVLALAAVGLTVCSVVALAGATDGNSFVVRQVVYGLVGIAVAGVVSRIDYARLQEVRWILYGFMLASIVAVALFGSTVNGSTLSIQLPFFSFQASELGKVLLAVCGAAVLVERSRAIDEWATTLRLLAFMGLPAVMVVTSDLGSGLVYGAVTTGVLLIGGTPGRHLGIIGAIAVTGIVAVLGLLPAAGVNVLKPYQVDRLTAFLHPGDEQGPGYQLNNAKIAIGSGQKTGRGDRATQQKLNYLPEKQTDFIFASVGERFGFMGAATILSLYALIMWRGLRILSTARDFYGAVLAAGILAMLLFEVLINAGMNVGIMPITGIPLPLVSYGGSSVLSTYLAIGLLQAIYAQGRAAARRGPTVARPD